VLKIVHCILQHVMLLSSDGACLIKQKCRSCRILITHQNSAFGGLLCTYGLLCFLIQVTLMVGAVIVFNSEQFRASCRSLPSRMILGFPADLIHRRIHSRILLEFCYRTSVLQAQRLYQYYHPNSDKFSRLTIM
jgi:hypothetical protein